MEGLLIFLLLVLFLYYYGPVLLRWLIRWGLGHAVKRAQQQAYDNAQRQQSHHQQRAASSGSPAEPKPAQGEKIFKEDEGEYIDFEEVK